MIETTQITGDCISKAKAIVLLSELMDMKKPMDYRVFDKWAKILEFKTLPGLRGAPMYSKKDIEKKRSLTTGQYLRTVKIK